MIVCSCNAIREADLRPVIAPHINTAEQLYACIGCKPRCGKCVAFVEGELLGQRPCEQPAN